VDKNVQPKKLVRCLVALCALAVLLPSGAIAAPLKEALLTQSIHDVQLLYANSAPRLAAVLPDASPSGQ
jgi:hypothetical protein